MNLPLISSLSVARMRGRSTSFCPAPSVASMSRPLLLFVVLCAGVAHAAVTHIPIKSGVVLKPGEAHTITVQATTPVEIGWLAVQARRCTTNCVQATDLTSSMQYSIATSLGASKEYQPVSGKVSVEYKNVSSEPVTINIYRVKRTCEAEACKFLPPGQKGRWLVFKVDEFRSIASSKDGSYSVISGVAESGKPFKFRAVWWTDEKPAFSVNCAPFINKFLNNHTPKDQYRPYVISGQMVGEPAHIILTSIDTCAPKAAHFGVPEENVFK